MQEKCWTTVLCSGLLSGCEMARLKCVSKLLRSELQNEASWPLHVYWDDLAAADLKEVLRLPVGGKLLHTCLKKRSGDGAADPELKLAACVHNIYAIDLEGCTGVTSSGLAHLSSQRHLQRLNLHGCFEVTDEGLAHLSSLPLHTLDLSECTEVTDEGLAHLSSLPLHTLSLSWTEVIDEGLVHLSSLPLHTLDLGYCTEVTDEGLAHLSSLPLQFLYLNGCTGLTDEGLAHLSSLPLQFLYLNGCTGLTGTETEIWRRKLALA